MAASPFLIASRTIRHYTHRLSEERGISMIVDKKAAATIGAYCNNVSEGARAVKRVTLTSVITPVIDYYLHNDLTSPVYLKVEVVPGGSEDAEPKTTVSKTIRKTV